MASKPKPDRSDSGGGARQRKGFPLRLPPELMEELRRWAAGDLRSLNAHIEYLLREAVKRRKGGAGDTEA